MNNHNEAFNRRAKIKSCFLNFFQFEHNIERISKCYYAKNIIKCRLIKNKVMLEIYQATIDLLKKLKGLGLLVLILDSLNFLPNFPTRT